MFRAVIRLYFRTTYLVSNTVRVNSRQNRPQILKHILALAIWICRYIRTFRRNILPPSSGLIGVTANIDIFTQRF